MKWDDIDQQVCSVARALSVLGERWTLLIIRDAFRGTRRFDDFQRSLGVTRHRLSERLGKLVDEGVLTRVAYMERPTRYEYRLTRKGLALYPVLMTLSQWGDDWMDDGNGRPSATATACVASKPGQYWPAKNAVTRCVRRRSQRRRVRC